MAEERGGRIDLGAVDFRQRLIRQLISLEAGRAGVISNVRVQGRVDVIGLPACCLRCFGE